MDYNLKEQIFEIFEAGVINYCVIDILKGSRYRLSDFIESKSFFEDILPRVVKENPQEDYLRNLVNPENISVEDFKILSREGVYDYVKKYFQPFIECNKDIDVPKLFGRFSDLTSDTLEAYILDKKWFTMNDIRINEREYMCFDDYLLILWFNKSRTQLFSLTIYND